MQLTNSRAIAPPGGPVTLQIQPRKPSPLRATRAPRTMKSRNSTVTSVLLLAAGSASLFSCSNDGADASAPAATSATKTVPERSKDASTERTLNSMFGGLGKDSSEPSSLPPTLGFEESSEGLPTGGTWREHPLLADLNGDGLDDIIASNREEDGLNVWLRSAPSSWVPAIEGITRDLMYGGMDVADLNGDGRVDLVFASHKKFARVFLNREVEGNPEAVRWEEVPGALECTFLGLDVVLGDLNGDDHADAVTISQFAVDRAEGALAVYFGRGDGTFERREEFSTLLGRSRCGHQVELVDFDGNGLDDLFVTGEWGAQCFLTHRDEAGTVSFEERSEGLPAPANIGNLLYAFLPCELTGEPPLEVAFASLADTLIAKGERNDVGVLRWTGERWEQFDTGLNRDLAYRDVLSADFNGDGHGDLVLSGPGIGVVLYAGDGGGHFQALGMFEGTEAGGRCSIGDVDGDERPDLLISSGATKTRPDAGAIRVFLNRAQAFTD